MVGWVLSALHGEAICLPLSAGNSAGADAGISLVSRIIVVGGEEKAVLSLTGSIVPRNVACRVGAAVGAKVGIGGLISGSREATTIAEGVGVLEIMPV